MKLYLSDRWKRRGSALWIVANLLRYFYDDINIETYKGQDEGVLLSYNVLPKNVSKKVKKILLIGGFKLNDNGLPRKCDWNRIDHVVFNSYFFRRIVLSRYKDIKNSSVIYILGGAPADPHMFSPIKKRRLNQEINFVICAKWWKRKFKRIKQSIHLFNNYIIKQYPTARLHVLGNNINNDKRQHNIYYYRKTFHRDTVIRVFSKSDIQIILTPFDSGPLTLTESLHYRVPFICSLNCVGPELMNLINGKCGECVKIDPLIKSFKYCLKKKPITNKLHYNKILDYKKIMNTINQIVQNYDDYVGWEWTNEFNYESQAKKWYNLIKMS